MTDTETSDIRKLGVCLGRVSVRSKGQNIILLLLLLLLLQSCGF